MVFSFNDRQAVRTPLPRTLLSEDVVAAAKAFLDRLAETIPQAMGGQMRIEEASDRFNSLMTPERKLVVAAMRRDLKTKR